MRTGYLALYPSGSAAAVHLAGFHGGGGKRGAITRFSRASARRLTRALMSVHLSEEFRAKHQFYAVTLTCRLIPSSHTVWREATRKLYRWLRFRGIEYFSVTELQKRGAPHLHLTLATPPRFSPYRLFRFWTRLLADGSSVAGQHFRRLRAWDCWSKYISKHLARTSAHVQRSGLPPGWARAPRFWSMSRGWARAEATYLVPSRTAADYASVSRRLHGGKDHYMRTQSVEWWAPPSGSHSRFASSLLGLSPVAAYQLGRIFRRFLSPSESTYLVHALLPHINNVLVPVTPENRNVGLPSWWRHTVAEGLRAIGTPLALLALAQLPGVELTSSSTYPRRLRQATSL